jgi:hypothetical protein
LYFSFKTQNPSEAKIIDTLKYAKTHQNLNSIEANIKKTTTNLYKKGYIDNKIGLFEKINDSTFNATIYLGEQIKTITLHNFKEIVTSSKNSKPTIKEPTILQYELLQPFLDSILKNQEDQGYPLTKIQLLNLKRNKNNLEADLLIELNVIRRINSLIIPNAKEARLPKGHQRNIEKKYLNKVYNLKTLQSIYEQYNTLGFVKNSKYPELLLTQDSTKVFVYLEKQKANKFDGFVGLNTAENGRLSGYLDFELLNSMQKGERISINWRSNGSDQKVFDAQLDLPYLFNSPLGIKTNLNIFRQDSTFQNTKTALSLYYQLHSNKKIAFEYQSTISSSTAAIDNLNTPSYSNRFITGSFELSNSKDQSSLSGKETFLQVNLGFGQRQANTQSESSNQLLTQIHFKQIAIFSQKIHLLTNSKAFILRSPTYIQNELYRFGGLNSLRGFNENSLQASYAASIMTELRYVLARQLYFHSILDYAYTNDQTQKNESLIKTNLVGLGVGLGLQTKNGILKLAFANGLSNGKNLNTRLIHLSYNVKF